MAFNDLFFRNPAVLHGNSRCTYICLRSQNTDLVAYLSCSNTSILALHSEGLLQSELGWAHQGMLFALEL